MQAESETGNSLISINFIFLQPAIPGFLIIK